MLAVTIHAARRAGSPKRMTHTVNAAGVLFGRFIMASSAVNRLGRHIVVRVFARDIRMTTGAGICAMHRRRKFRFIDKEPNRFAGRVGFVERFIGMAFEAGGVGIFFGTNCAVTRDEQTGNQ